MTPPPQQQPTGVVGVYIDLSGCGIGNVVSGLAGFLVFCRGKGLVPHVFTDAPENDLECVRPDMFRLLSALPAPDSGWINISLAHFISILTLFDPAVRAAMREIIVEPADLQDMLSPIAGAQAGFCIRTSDERHDDSFKFMNDTAVQAMKNEMASFDKVSVCSNDARHLRDLPPNAVVLELTDPEQRNASGHWIQWKALARCPIVFHGVGGADGSITSTFAPIAALLGGKSHLVGVDNSGDFHSFSGYRW